MLTWLRRLAGVLLFPFGWWVYQTLCVRTTFACDRDTAACTLAAEGPAGNSILAVPLAEVLGANVERDNVMLSPQALEILARARTIDDVDFGKLYAPAPGRRRQSGHRVVIYTTKGVVPLTPEYAADERTEPSVLDFNTYITDRKPGRVEVVVDESLRARISALAPCVLGVVLIVLPRKREQSGP